MAMLITSVSTEAYAKREAGGKGYNLYLLARQGLSVPPFAVLGVSFFQRFRESAGLDERLRPILLRAAAPGADLGAASREIDEIITSTPLPPDVASAIHEAWVHVGAERVAVRSSAADEDSAQHSFAGQLSSYLFVSSAEEAERRVRQCWASGFSERGLSYRIQNGFDVTAGVQVAVVIQAMIDAEKAGVMFTCDPISGDPSRYVINAVWGVGEGLVSGALDADTFVVAKADGAVIETTVTTKAGRFVRGGDEGVREEPVPEELRDVACLDEAELRALADQGRRIGRFYHHPQDVEWGYRDGVFYVLQARPVTTPVRQDEGVLNVWDNSNIVESYGGLTLPLTFTFAHYVYHQVYVQFCEILSVPPHEIRNMDSFLQNMLGIFHGRVYYNILNWYKLTSILPGYKHNRQFMETMMGTQHQLQDEIAERVKLGYNSTLGAKWRRFVTGCKFFWYHLTAQSMVDGFLRHFHAVYDEYRSRDYDRAPASDIYRDYKELTVRLLHEWKAPIINDFLCMVHFGLFKKLTESWLAGKGDMLQNDLLCGEGNLESAEPTRELIRMAALVAADPDLKRLMEETPAHDCLEALVRSPHAAFRARVDRYIDLYGHRCMSEMKLEQRDLHQDPSFLFSCLKNYLRSGQTDLDEYERRERDVRLKAERTVRESLTGWRRWVYDWSMHHARKAVRNRENTRFCRTRIYGVVRRMFFGWGNELTLRGLIDRPEDVFYLTLSELTGTLDGVLPCQDLRALVATRKASYVAYEDFEPASRFVTRGLAYWSNELAPPEKGLDTSDLPPNCLKGLGCCPGVVEGTVKVVLSPDDDLELQGEILVTKRTDPGWIPLYPSVSGLLVERGGLLSHSAIVAREMGLPTVVSIKDLTARLTTGMKVRLDGTTGVIEILDGE